MKQMKLCLKNATSGSQWSLLHGTQTQKLQLNSQGCLEWQDQVAFDYAIDHPHYIEQSRILENSLGEQKKFHFFVNPWVSYRGDMMQREFLQKAPLQVVNEKTQERGLGQIWMDHLQLNILKRSENKGSNRAGRRVRLSGRYE